MAGGVVWGREFAQRWADCSPHERRREAATPALVMGNHRVMAEVPIDELVYARIQEQGPQDPVTLTLWLRGEMPDADEFGAMMHIAGCSLRRLAAAGRIVLDSIGFGSLPGRQ